MASGDPYTDSMILWTRVALSIESDESGVTVSGDVPLYNYETERYVRASMHPVCVRYGVFDEEGMGKVVDQGMAWTSSVLIILLRYVKLRNPSKMVSLTTDFDNGNRSRPKDLIRLPHTFTDSTSVTPMFPVPLEGPRLLLLRMETRRKSSSRFTPAASGVCIPAFCCLS